MSHSFVTAFYCFGNPSVPDSFICVGSRLRQIDAFRPFRRVCTRLTHRRMLWMVSKDWAAVSKARISQISQFFDFASQSLRADCARLRGHWVKKSWNLWYSRFWFFRIVRVRVFWQKVQLFFMIEKPLPDLLTLFTTFYDVSVLCNRFLKTQKAQIWAFGNEGVK